VASSCEHCKDPSVSTNGGQFLGQPRDYDLLVSHERLFSVKFIVTAVSWVHCRLSKGDRPNFEIRSRPGHFPNLLAINFNFSLYKYGML
jgi:hypothetical protein